MARAHGLYNGVTNGGSAVAGIFTRRRDTHGAHIQCRPPAQSRAPDASNLCWWACTAAVTSASASPPRCSGTVGSGRTNTGLAVAAYEYTTDHREDAPGPGAVRFGSEAWSVFPNGLELAAMISQVYMMAATLQVPPPPPPPHRMCSTVLTVEEQRVPRLHRSRQGSQHGREGAAALGVGCELTSISQCTSGSMAMT